MYHLNSSSPSGPEWDNNYARIYLKVSEDQLEKIDKIPGWSKTEISKTVVAENDKNLENIEKQLVQETSNSTEDILTTGVNISAKGNDNLKNQNYDSDIQSKKNPITPLNEKELFLKNVSLSPLRKKYTSSYSIKRSKSLPDLFEKLLSTEVTSRSNSEEIYRKQIHSIEKDLCLKSAPLLTKNILNKTFTVPGISDDCLNHNKLLEKSLKSLTSTLEIPHHVSKQKFKTLDDSILNHKYLKDTETSSITSDANPLFSDGTAQTTLKQVMSSFDQKLMLLEKRLSPSKEMSQPPFNSKLINLENLNHKKNLKLPQSPEQADKVVTAVVSADSIEESPDEIESSVVSKKYKSYELSDDIESSVVSKKYKSYESPANSQLINENGDAPKNALKSAKDRTSDTSKTAGCNFDSFLTPPIPCGQPVPTEILSHSQQILPPKSADMNFSTKSQNMNPFDPCEQLLPSLSQPILSQKLAKFSTPSKSQNAKLVNKHMAPEKSSGTFSVFSANLNEKVSDLASDKELCSKRKRKSRSEKSSKKLKKTSIQFSSAQIKNMIEIMKIFHLEF